MFKKVLAISLSFIIVLSTVAVSFAGEKEIKKENVTYLEDVEFEITEDDIDENGHFEIEIAQESDAASRGIIADNNQNVSNNALIAKKSKLPSIVVEGFAKKNSWKGTTLELGIGCKATGGKIKTYKGTCNIYKANGIAKITSKKFSMTDNEGTKNLVRQYTFNMGSNKSCKVKLTNQVAIDTYGRSGSLYSYQTGTIKK